MSNVYVILFFAGLLALGYVIYRAIQIGADQKRHRIKVQSLARSVPKIELEEHEIVPTPKPRFNAKDATVDLRKPN